jgi:ribosome biogenesis GTPase / thiamine phosphate phosphatase
MDPLLLGPIGLSVAIFQSMKALDADPRDRPMRVVEVQRGLVRLHDGQAVHAAQVPPSLQQRFDLDDDALAVGDWVLAATDDFGGWHVCQRVPPRVQLTRLTNDGRGGPKRQVLVANIDTAILLMGLDHDFNLRRLERYLALARSAGCAVVVVLSKADLVDEAVRARRLEQVRELAPAGVQVLALDGRSSIAVDALAPWLTPGQTLVLLGSSGAGKSTLTNTLLGDAVQSTGGVRRGDERGRHTTTVRTLHALPCGACLIDTPGLRGLRLDLDDGQALKGVFADIAEAANQCRFRDCRHQDEPGCAVRDQVPGERLRNYHKLLREARRDTMSALERREQKSQWKIRHKAGAVRARTKRGEDP